MTKTVIALVLLSIYTVLEIISYMPQIIKIIRTKSADDLSLASWASWVISDVCYLAYVLMESPEFGVVFTACLSLFFVITVYVLTVYYQKTNPRKKIKKSFKQI